MIFLKTLPARCAFISIAVVAAFNPRSLPPASARPGFADRPALRRHFFACDLNTIFIKLCGFEAGHSSQLGQFAEAFERIPLVS
jgi:hypothetical protein